MSHQFTDPGRRVDQFFNAVFFQPDDKTSSESLGTECDTELLVRYGSKATRNILTD